MPATGFTITVRKSETIDLDITYYGDRIEDFRGVFDFQEAFEDAGPHLLDAEPAADRRRDRGPGHAQFGERSETEDQARVEDQVDAVG